MRGVRMARKNVLVATVLLVACANSEAIHASGTLEDNDYRTCVSDHNPTPACDQLEESNLATMHLCRGIGFRDRGERDRAIAEFSEAVRLRQNFAQAFCFRGLEHDDAGDQELAILDYNQSIFLDPAFLESAGTNRSVAYFHKKDY